MYLARVLKIILNQAVGRISSMLPIQQNKVIFDNFNGQGFGGNTKYIALKLLENNKFSEYVWIVDEIGKYPDIPEIFIQVKRDTPSAIYHLATSKLWIFNTRKGNLLKKRKEQLYIQAWHGLIGIKKVEGQVVNGVAKGYKSFAKRDSKNLDIILSTCSLESEIMRQYFWIEDTKKVLETGSPEYDYLYHAKEKEKERIHKKLGTQGRKILLYVPTFRKDKKYDYFNLDFCKVVSSLKNKFGGEWVFLYRLHPNIRNIKTPTEFNGICAINVTQYEDIQELSLVSDVVLTDYSSTIFGPAILYAPAFLYAPDLEAYKNERDFEFVEEQLPFTISHNSEELLNNIDRFDYEKYQGDVKAFFKRIGMIFDGNSSNRVYHWLEERI